jgi:hypothetical protein
MDQQQITKEMMEFNKSVMDSTFNAISSIQDQSVKMLTAFMEKATWLPDDGKKAITDWVSAYKKGRNDFKAETDKKYETVANYFMKNESATISRMKKNMSA